MIAAAATTPIVVSNGLQACMLIFAAIAATGVLWRFLTRPRLQFTGTAMMLVGWLGLGMTIVPKSVQDQPVLLATAFIIGMGVASFIARWLAPRREWLLIAGAAVMPLRVPVPLGGETYSLLLPLYGVILIAAMIQLRRDHALALACVADTDTDTDVPDAFEGLAPSDVAVAPARARTLSWSSRGPALALDLPLALLVAWASMSIGWSIDMQTGAQRIALFILPFALLYAVLRAWLDDGLELARPARAFLVVMVGAALAGIFQHATGHVWQNAKVEVANVFAPDFRTNSIFWDPNIYGRYIVATMALVLTPFAAAQIRTRRLLWRILALTALLGLALWYTYSQSSFIALAVVCVVMVFLASGHLVRVALLIALAASVIGLPIAAHQLRGNDEKSRSELISYGADLAAEAPIEGLGIGSFESGVIQLSKNRGVRVPKLRASHTTPVTLLAELGVIGLGAWIALIAGGLTAGLAPGYDNARWWAVATLAGLIAHSMFYAAFLEDPITWVALAVISSRVHDRVSSACVRSAGDSSRD